MQGCIYIKNALQQLMQFLNIAYWYALNLATRCQYYKYNINCLVFE